MSSKGYKHTEEAKKKMSEKAFIRKHSLETKSKISKSRSMDKHPLWKNGISKGKENMKSYQKENQRKKRLAILEIMGSKCVRCGFNDKRALQIDHIKGGGVKSRKKETSGKGYAHFVLQSFLKGEGRYQLLCANCNWIKRDENNEVRKCVDTCL